MNTYENLKVNRKFKDNLFRMLYSDKNRLLELYNGLNSTDYHNPDELEITTWEDVIYLGMKNDISMMINGYLNLYEHQSTWNTNMPLRGFFYFADLYRHLTKDKNLYSSKQIYLPTPVYVVFYNGIRKMAEQEEMRLSDSFVHGNVQSAMELKVQMININYGHNQELMEKCRTLAEYSYFVGKVRDYQQKMELKDAILRATDECIEAGVLAGFLKERCDDVMNALLTEYDEERVLKDLREESFEDGVTEGERLKVIELVLKKVEKGLGPKEIAEILEEDLKFIEEVYEMVQRHPGESSPREIYSKLQDESNTGYPYILK